MMPRLPQSVAGCQAGSSALVVIAIAGLRSWQPGAVTLVTLGRRRN